MFAGLSGIARGDELSMACGSFRGNCCGSPSRSPAMVAPLVVHYRKLRLASYWLYGLSLILLCVWCFSVRPANGARGWIPLESPTFSPRS